MLINGKLGEAGLKEPVFEMDEFFLGYVRK